MEKVEVAVSIAEIGQAGSPLIQYHGLFVALETKGINFKVKRIIEFLYKIIFQYLCVRGCMRFMACVTQSVPDRAVFINCFFYICTHFFVTTEAKVHFFRPLFYEFFEVIYMSGVTVGTLPLSYRLMGGERSTLDSGD
jgi:hypothetical protein